MAGGGVFCGNCGHELAENERPCSKCGDTRRVHHVTSTMHVNSKVTVTTTVQKIRREIVKNWSLIVVLVMCDLISIIPAYFWSGWPSVGATVFFILLSTGLGYFAITRMVTITRETQ
jgi:uncharacterized membrane protein YvbJ